MKNRFIIINASLIILIVGLLTINLSINDEKEYVVFSQNTQFETIKKNDDFLMNNNFNNDYLTMGEWSEPRLNYDSLCEEEGFRVASKIAGIIILFATWIVPLVLIVTGMLDFGKAMISDDEKSLNKATGSFIKRMVIAIIIPFIPGLIFTLIDYIDDMKGIADSNEFITCTNCLRYPLSNCKK